MKTSILNKYHLRFVNIEIYGEKWKHCSISNSNSQTTLGCFLSCWQKMNKIDRLLRDIDDLLLGTSTDIATGCDAVLIDIYKDVTEFYDISAKPNFDSPDLVMPTMDFRAILKEWRRFLEMPAVFDTKNQLIEVS
jgi:hypothetical protein